MIKKTKNAKRDCAIIQFGEHLLLDCYGCTFSRLKDKELMKKMTADIPKKIGMHLILDPIVVEVGPKNRKDPGGLSGFVMIAESHMSFHTFPTRGFVTIDVYTCQDKLPVKKLIAEFKTLFQFKTYEMNVIARGTKYPSCDIYE